MNMNKNVKIAIIAFIVLLGLGAGAYVYLTKFSPSSKEIKKDSEVKRLEGYPTMVNTTKEIEKKRVVIKTQEELNTFLNEIDETGQLVVKENVDFEKNYIIAVSSATYSEAGHTLKVNKIYEDQVTAKILVSIKETELGKSCDITPAKVLLTDLVLIDKTDKKIDFERVKSIKECDQ